MVNPNPIHPLLAAPERRVELESRAPDLLRIDVDDRTAADLELLGNGGFTPLGGFLERADYDSVVERMRLASGAPWSIPITLAVAKDVAARIGQHEEVALWFHGRPVAVMVVRDRYEPDKSREARLVYRTEDIAHPGVAALMQSGPVYVGGPVEVLVDDLNTSFGRYRFTPEQLRAEFAKRGWRRIVAFQTRNPIHRAHEYLTKCALEMVDGLLIHPLVGETKGDDIPADVRMKCYEVLLEKYYPRDRSMLAVFPAAMRYAGPREAIFHALVRRNYGCTHFIVGRDHAGVGNYYGTYDAQLIFNEFKDGELGITPVFFDHTFYCKACYGIASEKTCVHDPAQRVAPSGTKVRQLLRDGQALPTEFSRPEVARILLEAHHPELRNAQQGGRPAAQDSEPGGTSVRPGFVLWFTGLSGSGKSTIAEAITREFDKRGVGYEVLDGDVVRTHLSKGLGFSKEDRDTNIRRIGWVARTLAKHGAVPICAAISPYRNIRDEIRRDAGRFVEVYVKAPLDVCESRDVKGLYKKARAGELKGFTGIDDPYEEPMRPEVVCETDRESVAESAAKILRRCEELGYLPAAR